MFVLLVGGQTNLRFPLWAKGEQADELRGRRNSPAASVGLSPRFDIPRVFQAGAAGEVGMSFARNLSPPGRQTRQRPATRGSNQPGQAQTGGRRRL